MADEEAKTGIEGMTCPRSPSHQWRHSLAAAGLAGRRGLAGRNQRSAPSPCLHLLIHSFIITAPHMDKTLVVTTALCVQLRAGSPCKQIISSPEYSLGTSLMVQ